MERMNIGVLGTGVVGRTLAQRLVELGHSVCLGSRSADSEAGQEWLATVGTARGASVGTFADAAAHGALLVNATSGGASIAALRLAGERNLRGKVLVDVANPLDFSTGALQLTVVNTDSLAEQIQRRLKEEGHGKARIEGDAHCDWVVIDIGDIIVHVFRPEVREFYNLEKMWSGERPTDPVTH